MIGRGKVVVLLLAAVAVGLILSASLNLSPLTNAFWGGGEKEKAGEAAPVAVGKVRPLEDIPPLV